MKDACRFFLNLIITKILLLNRFLSLNEVILKIILFVGKSSLNIIFTTTIECKGNNDVSK